MTYNMFMFYEFAVFSNSRKWPKFRQNILSISKMNRYPPINPLPVVNSLLGQFRPSKFIGERGGGALRTISISYSAKVCVSLTEDT